MCRDGLLALLLAAGLAVGGRRALAAEARIIEDFETPAAVQSSGGKLLHVRLGEGITHGKRAIGLPPGASVHLTLDGVDSRATAWLKIDTLTSQPVTQELSLAFQEPGRKDLLVAYVQPGKDTLCVPLTVVAGRMPGGWPKGKVAFSITNSGDSAVILDCARVEPPAQPPAGSTLLDFGPPRQPVWPGFSPAGVSCRHLAWSGDRTVRPSEKAYPDPLTGDYIGPHTFSATSDHVVLSLPGDGPGAAWLWVTHYSQLHFQPPQYSVTFRGRAVKRRSLSRRQMLSHEGILEGRGGQWTAEWFDRVYAGRFFDALQLSLPSRRNQIDLNACQLAAVAIAPATRRAELEEYVRQVHSDLSRYRRQFVLAVRADDSCRLSPTKAEAGCGLMVFEPPADGALRAGWAPGASDRAETIRALGANGSLTVAAFAVVPTKRAASLSVALVPASAGGRPLPAGKPGASAWLLERVPYLASGRASFLPWVLTRELAGLRENEVVHGVVTIPVPRSAQSGTYRGAIRLSHSAGHVQVPIEMEVVHIAERGTAAATFLPDRVMSTWRFYHTLSDMLSVPERDAVQLRVSQALLDGGLNSMFLTGPELSSSLTVSDAPLARELKIAPIRSIQGPVMLDFTGMADRLASSKIPAGSVRYLKIVRTAVAKGRSLALRYKLRDPFCYMAHAKDAASLAGA
ncbi:MAG: hypothetical protein WBF17_13575, partial [Phycisphaerae bacterium]